MPTIKPMIRQPWSRERVTVNLAGQVGVTDRSWGNDTDVNKIVARFTRHPEEMPDPDAQTYADVTNLQTDLSELINRSREALNEYREAERQLEEKQNAVAQENAEKAAQLEQMLAQQQQSQTPTEG